MMISDGTPAHRFSQRMRSPAFASVVLIAAQILLASGCGPTRPSLPQPGPAKVTWLSAAERELTDFDEFVGRTEASETVEVRSRVSGFIKSVDFRDGDIVTKGQPLFKIEPDTYQAIQEQSESRIELWKSKKELAQSRLTRNERLLATNTISQDEYNETLAAVREADANIVAAQDYTDVKAEIEGKIDRAFVTPGNVVTGGLGTGTLLTRIVKNSPIYAYVDVDERTFLRYARRFNDPNQPEAAPAQLIPVRDRNVGVEMQLADDVGFPHRGFLDFIENRVDAATGTIRIRAVFENKNLFLTGGLFVRLRIPTSPPYKATLIPEQSISTDQSFKYCWVLGADDLPERRDLTLGPRQGEWRVIRAGIQAGERVVVEGVQRVRAGQKVEAKQAPAMQN
ncbi:MAG: efflux RND transporter periplasmic adaptor subunit [Blastopirellula sp.]|nr:efflux RND transporter periplasmic adaptor subunit [Blastopirellula sp.]